MESGLNTALTVSIILITGCILVFIIFLIQILNILKRILTKIEFKIDSFELTQEEIKLKLLNFIEDILIKIKNYGKNTESVLKSLRLEKPTIRKGGVKGEKKD